MQYIKNLICIHQHEISMINDVKFKAAYRSPGVRRVNHMSETRVQLWSGCLFSLPCSTWRGGAFGKWRAVISRSRRHSLSSNRRLTLTGGSSGVLWLLSGRGAKNDARRTRLGGARHWRFAERRPHHDPKLVLLTQATLQAPRTACSAAHRTRQTVSVVWVAASAHRIGNQ